MSAQHTMGRRAWLLASLATFLVAAPALAVPNRVMVTVETVKNDDGTETTKVKIKGDAGDNQIVITIAEGALVVTGKGDTKINFNGRTTFPIPDDLRIRMSTGSDSVEIQECDLAQVRIEDTADGPGDGTDHENITITGGKIRVFYVRTGRGNDRIINDGGEVENDDVDPGVGTNTVEGFDE